MAALELTTTVDATMDQSLPDTNTGSGVTCLVRNAVGSIKQRSAVTFDRSLIGADWVISAATLKIECALIPAGSATGTCELLWIDASEPGPPGLPALTEADVTWNTRATGAIWNTAGGDFETNVTPPTFTIPTSLGEIVTINVLDIVEYARTNYAATTPDQIGFCIRQSAGTGRTWSFASKENILGQMFPTLTITYTEPPSSIASRPIQRRAYGRPYPTGSRPFRGPGE